jgi:pyruvate kinase
MEAGVNVFRLNMSHGDQADHAKAIQSIRQISTELSLPTAILVDLQGPKIRLGAMQVIEPSLCRSKICPDDR